MNAREYLESMLNREKHIRIKSAQVARLRDSLTNLTAPTDKERVSSTKNVTTMAQTIACIIDLEKELDMQTASLLAQRMALFHMLDQMNPEDAMIIVSRFIEGKSYKDVGQACHISIRQVCRRITCSVDRLQEIMDHRKVGVQCPKEVL